MIPQSNPGANYHTHKVGIDKAIEKVLNSGWYILGDEVSSFEQEFALSMGATQAIGVASGTDALELALRANEIGKGDYVITTSHTAVATAAAIARTGAKPIFVDIDPDTFTMDPQQLEELLASWKHKKPKAVIPVHLYGQSANMTDITAIAKKHDIFVIEDCAQAHGATHNNKKVGTWGNIGCFSLYPTKNLGALGDAGIVITNDKKIAERLRYLREYGWKKRYISDVSGGINSRLDELQAAVLRVKLPHLNHENDLRRNIADTYTSILNNHHEIVVPKISTKNQSVFHQYVIQIQKRDSVQVALKAKGIGTLIHYPVAVHQQPAFADSQLSPLPLRNTEQLVSRILSLPMYPELKQEKCNEIARAVLEVITN